MSLPSDPSVFDILNLFHCQWFLSRDWLVSNVASAQWTEGLSIDWVEFPPTAHTHLMRCAIKLAPSVPAAKVKWVMFVFVLEVLNDDGPVSSFFTPCRVHVSRKQRTCKPREGGDQPISAMAIDAPPPVAPSQPDPPGPLSPGLMPGNGDPSSEEPAGNGFNVTLGQASSSPGVSPTPSDCTVVPMPPSRPGPSRPPSVLGVKCSPPPASPSPPLSPPVTPSSPPSHIGTSSAWIPQDWWDWIALRWLATSRKMKTFCVTTEDVRLALRDCEDLALHQEAKDMEHFLLRQVENVVPPTPSAPPPIAGPSLAPVASPSNAPALTPSTYHGAGLKAAHAICFLPKRPPFQCYLLDGPNFIHLQWLQNWELPLISSSPLLNFVFPFFTAPAHHPPLSKPLTHSPSFGH